MDIRAFRYCSIPGFNLKREFVYFFIGKNIYEFNVYIFCWKSLYICESYLLEHFCYSVRCLNVVDNVLSVLYTLVL